MKLEEADEKNLVALDLHGHFLYVVLLAVCIGFRGGGGGYISPHTSIRLPRAPNRGGGPSNPCFVNPPPLPPCATSVGGFPGDFDGHAGGYGAKGEGLCKKPWES